MQRHLLNPWECPSCKKMVYQFPAISRKDNKTKICPACGAEEALNALFSDLYKKKKVAAEALNDLFTELYKKKKVAISEDDLNELKEEDRRDAVYGEDWNE